ncbi:MAG TPA: hypothetical protein PJ991_02910 [Kiritimatiellia bacterium]|nr:hypothetical protein [Kiritimatiellia bacterium]
MSHDPETFWMSRAVRLRRMVNSGWWWAEFSVLFVIISLFFSFTFFILRSLDMDLAWSIRVWILLLFIAIPVSTIRARRKYIDLSAAFSRLDITHGLHNVLVSAYARVCPWPEAPPAPNHCNPVRISWINIFKPVSLSLLLMVMAFKIPVMHDDSEVFTTRHEPPEWQAVEYVTELMREQKLVQEEALNKVEEQIETLRNKPSQEWFRQGTMEATSHVRDQLSRDSQRLQRTLEKTAAMLSAAYAHKQQGIQSLPESQLNMWRELLEQLGLQELPLNADQLAALKEIDLAQLRQLSAADLMEIEARLQEQSDLLKQCLADAGMAGQLSAGGINRGPGTLPLTLKDEESRLNDVIPTPISNPNLDQAVLGQIIGLAEGMHDVDTDAYQGAREAGMTASPGGEGEVIWRQDLLPSDQQVLKRYFK